MFYVTTTENTMNHRKQEEPVMFNVVLAELLGFDKIIDPDSVKFGGCNVYRLFTGFLVVYVGLMSVITCFNGLYNWTGHRDEAMFHLGIAEISVFICYKMSIIVLRWRQIRNCLSVTRFDFTSYGRCRDDARLLNLWRRRVVLITSAYAVTCLIAVTSYVSSPLMFSHGVTTMKSLDGSQSDYRINAINLYAMFSAETYNAHFNVIYFIEASFLCTFEYFFVIFDTLLITLCLAFSCQLKVINLAFASSGPKRFITNYVQNDSFEEIGSNKVYSSYEHFVAYKELKSIITDHQSIIKKLENFFSIFQAVMLSQIITSTFIIIAILLNVATKFADGKIDEGSKATIIKMIVSCPMATIQLFMTCYLFEYLQNQKESIVFALYSSNWTEMDMKCRELILLSLCMNNAHRRKLKFSQLKIVNLEMFFFTMRVCYSVVSMILNYKSN